MSQLFLKKTILEVAYNQDDPPLYWIPTPFWTPALYAHNTQNLQKIKGFRQQKDWFRHLAPFATKQIKDYVLGVSTFCHSVAKRGFLK
jgi:hypothetical protein